MNADLHHIRTHATLLAAQARLDAMAEPEPDEDWLTEDQALESAQAMLASTPNLVSGWLDAECSGCAKTLCAYELRDVLNDEKRELTTPELLTIIMDGSDAYATRARHLLRERFDAAHAEVAADDARRMLDEQERERALAEESFYADLEAA